MQNENNRWKWAPGVEEAKVIRNCRAKEVRNWVTRISHKTNKRVLIKFGIEGVDVPGFFICS
jgi:hypothetical protein